MSLRIEERVIALEARMTDLETLPARVDRLATELGELRTEARAEFAAVRREISSVEERLSTRIEDARRETRVLHEDVIERLAVLGEGLATVVSSSVETRAILDTVTERLTTIESRLPVPRRRKRNE